MSLLETLKSQLGSSEQEYEEHELTLEFIREAPPTPNGNLPRKSVKFKELPRPIYVLNSRIIGILSNGQKVKTTFTKNGEYTNIVSIEGTAYSDKMQFVAKERLTVAL